VGLTHKIHLFGVCCESLSLAEPDINYLTPHGRAPSNYLRQPARARNLSTYTGQLYDSIDPLSYSYDALTLATEAGLGLMAQAESGATRQAAQDVGAAYSDYNDSLVEPGTPPDPQKAYESNWGFSSRLQAGRAGSGSSHSSKHFRPTRHASLDAGYLQQRAYAAAQVLEGSGTVAGVGTSSANSHSSGKGRSAGGTPATEGIEIAWVRLSGLCCGVGVVSGRRSAATSTTWQLLSQSWSRQSSRGM
jgi:hypothetical protein